MSGHLKIANNIRHEICPLCGTEKIQKVGDISYLKPTLFSTTEVELERVPEYWRCTGCGSFFVQNVIPERIAFELYFQGESSERWASIPFTSNKPAPQVHCLSKYLQPGKRILDIGCNTGELLDYAKTFDCVTTGVEFSDSSRDILEGKGHMTFTALENIKEKYDVITAFDLVEHLYDVPEFFRQCKELLTENGVLIILTGNATSCSARLSKARWWYLKYPEHIVFPSTRFYASVPGYNIQEWIRTYASIGYKKHIWFSFKRLISENLNGIYNGLPSIGPDHLLMVMKQIG